MIHFATKSFGSIQGEDWLVGDGKKNRGHVLKIAVKNYQKIGAAEIVLMAEGASYHKTNIR